MQLKVQAGNRNGDRQLTGLWDGRRIVLNARGMKLNGAFWRFLRLMLNDF